MSRKSTLITLWVGFLWIVPTPAVALLYLDPITGSILWQGLIALIGAVVSIAGIYWRSTRALLRRVLHRGPGSASDNPLDS